ncbi:sugar transferase [Paenibacillus sp. MBLB4367]|uniref:sugar transferase n=1 Tax=Paenibacillus sp. MBLB4367 TaxID=3384767 RepID=UPI0039081717
MKRSFDVLVSLCAIALLFPIILLFALLVKLKLGSPVLFTQQRPGLHGKPFVIYKFRTMLNSVDDAGNLLPDGLRLTAFGKFLRKFSIDELPQLFNIFKGDISLVGPRPLLMEYLPIYTPSQARRHEVRPGLTGWAQVNGRNAISWEEKFAMDLWYVENRSFLLDLKIIWLTVKEVLDTRDVRQEVYVTMPLYTGEKEIKDHGL